MTGYVNYFSATSLYAAWQAGVKPISPYAEAQMPDGTWQRIAEDVGFPAGLERTIVVDLTGKLPAGARRIRLMTNLEIYWDQVLIDQSANARHAQTEMPLASATLHFRGYPKQIDLRQPRRPGLRLRSRQFDGAVPASSGAVTPHGRRDALVKSIDDRYVMFGSGEEIAAEFDTTQPARAAPNWKRDYFFYANGYEKDMDWWDASPFTVAQLPFHGMSSYPYPASEKFPDDAASLAYQLELE
jgi:hypothetical protein